MNFCDFAGNISLKDKIRSIIKTGHIPNAILIEGENGTGKSTFAKIVANALLCSGIGDRPCGTCRDCDIFKSGGHPDLVTICGTGKTGIISVDSIREISETINILPNQSEYRVYIIEDAQNMTVQAQNALLKVLEEPPAFVVFILTCESKFGLLQTILSRTQTFTLSTVSKEEAVKVLQKQFPDISTNELEIIAERHNGNIGASLDVLKDKNLSLLNEKICNIAKSISNENEYSLMIVLSYFEKEKGEFEKLLSAFRTVLRDAMVLKISGGICISSCYEAATLLSENMTDKNIFDMIDVINEFESILKRNVYFPLLLTEFCSKLWETSR